MVQQRNKGQAGMGGRGKNQKKGRQDQATRRRKKLPLGEKKGGATLTPPSKSRRLNQKRNQTEWHERRRQAVRY
jgi:hypothetical protein